MGTSGASLTRRLDLSAKLARRIAGYKLLGKRSPAVVSFAVTMRCPHNCAMCGTGMAGKEELPTVDALSIIDRLADAGTVLFSFTGGEPFLRADLERLVDRCRERGCHVSVNTSGYRLREHRPLLENLRGICLSLDGPEEVNDRIRYEGAYRDTVDGVSFCRDLGLRVRMTSTINRLNMDRLADTARVAAELKTPILFQPAGVDLLRGEGANPYGIGEGEIAAAMRRLSDIARTNRYVANSPRALELFVSGRSGTGVPCLGGRLFARVDAGGRIAACSWNAPGGGGETLAGGPVKDAFERIPEAACPTCHCISRLEFNVSVAALPRSAVRWFARRV